MLASFGGGGGLTLKDRDILEGDQKAIQNRETRNGEEKLNSSSPREDARKNPKRWQAPRDP